MVCEYQYEQQMQIKNRQSYAPFGSVSSKKQKKGKNKLEGPGPGSYEIQLPLINPIVQTIKKKNNNIIVKLGHVGTSSFLANSQRFQQRSNKNVLGPGQYHNHSYDTTNHSQTKNARKYASVRLKQLIKNPMQRQPTISEVKKIDFEDQVEMPGKDEHLKKKSRQNNEGRGCAWSRMTESRSKSPLNSSTENLGPGSYNILLNQLKLKKQPSSAFVSNSVRSFFDQIRFETNDAGKARMREQRQYKSEGVGPGSYEVGLQRKKSSNQFQFFGSTEDRK